MTREIVDCGCITCGDQGIEMVVTALDARTGLARCADRDGAEGEVDVSLVAPVDTGTTVLVHAGVAIALAPGRADPAEHAARAGDGVAA